ncbi:MAG: DUF86 domain-containing protein [Deltaproteobacteria bacterium]|nr:DUF86 domain-containing protein [Deltaproteobacteria bacterium]
MVNQDVVFEKIKQIQNCLKRIHTKTKNGPKSLDDMDVQDIFVLNLQRAVQTTIDLAAHVIADEGLGLPSELKENFKILEQNKIIEPALSEKLQHMVGFRNIAVHDYSAIDPEILKSILKNNLKDLEEFYTIILKYFHLNQQ